MICHGYSRCCVCEQCLDRAARFELYAQELDEDEAAVLSCKESAEYLKTPWKFDKSDPPRRLREEENIVLR